MASPSSTGPGAPTTPAPPASTPTTTMNAMKGLIPAYNDTESVEKGEDDIIQFLATVRKIATLAAWDDTKTILAVEISVKDEAKNFLAALKAQGKFPADFKALEQMMMQRFYMLKTEPDRERLAASLKMKPNEKIRGFVDKVRIITARLQFSTRLEAKEKESDPDKKEILEHALDDNHDVSYTTSTPDKEKTLKIKVEATKTIWKAEMEDQMCRYFMKYIRNEFKGKLMQFGALSTLDFQQLVDKSIQLENAATNSNKEVNATASGKDDDDEPGGELGKAIEKTTAMVSSLQMQLNAMGARFRPFRGASRGFQRGVYPTRFNGPRASFSRGSSQFRPFMTFTPNFSRQRGSVQRFGFAAPNRGSNYRRPIQCFRCGGNHLARDCRSVPRYSQPTVALIESTRPEDDEQLEEEAYNQFDEELIAWSNPETIEAGEENEQGWWPSNDECTSNYYYEDIY